MLVTLQDKLLHFATWLPSCCEPANAAAIIAAQDVNSGVAAVVATSAKPSQPDALCLLAIKASSDGCVLTCAVALPCCRPAAAGGAGSFGGRCASALELW